MVKTPSTNGRRGWAKTLPQSPFSHFNTQPSHTTLLTNQNSWKPLLYTHHSFQIPFSAQVKLSSLTKTLQLTQKKEKTPFFSPPTHKNREHQRRKEEATKKLCTWSLCCILPSVEVCFPLLSFFRTCALNFVVRGFFCMNWAPMVAFGKRQPWCNDPPLHCMHKKKMFSLRVFLNCFLMHTAVRDELLD